MVKVLLDSCVSWAVQTIVHGIPHCGILRLVNLNAQQQSIVCLRVLTLYGEELNTGAIITAELGRARIRPPVKNN